MNRVRHEKRLLERLPLRLQRTLYVLAMSDFWLDTSWRGFGFSHWKEIHRRLIKALDYPLVSLPVLGVLVYLSRTESLVPMLLMVFGVFFALRSVLLHSSPFKAALEMGIASLLSWFSLFILDHHFLQALWCYMFSIVPALVFVILISWRFRYFDLRNFHAQGSKHVLMANLFFLSFLVLAGMPISSAFLGEDILLEELIVHSHFMTVFMTTILMINGLVCVKIYTRVFMGLSPMPRESEG